MRIIKYLSPTFWSSPRGGFVLLVIAFISVVHFDLANFITRSSKERVIPYLLSSDENFYFAYAHSLALDGDLDFTNQFKFLAFGPIGIGMNQTYRNDYFLEPDTPMVSKVGIGVGLVTLPFMFAGRLIVALYEVLWGAEVNRFAAFYVWVYKIGMLFWTFVGILAGYLLLRRLGRPHGTAAGAMAGSVLGLSLGYYMIFASSWTHTVSFGWVTLYLLVCSHWQARLRGGRGGFGSLTNFARLFQPGLLGVIAGVCCSIRFNNFLILIVPLIICLHIGCRYKGSILDLGGYIRLVLVSMATFAAGFGIGFLPQLLAWRMMYGEWVINTYARFGETLYPWSKFFFHILFHPRCGLFIWTPLAVFAVIGILVALRREGRTSPWPWICFYLLVSDVWFSGCWPGWHMGNTFGARYQSDYTFVFAYGLAALFLSVQARPLMRRFVWASVAILVALNFYLMMAFRARIIAAPTRPWAGPSPLRFRPLVTERKKVFKQLKKDCNLFWRLDNYRDYTRRYPLMTPADLGLPTPEEHQRMFDFDDAAASDERWKRVCIEVSEKSINAAR